MSARINPTNVALVGGHWEPRGGVQVWVPAAEVEPASPPETPRATYVPVVACRCGALTTETCRTRSGHRSKDHPGRKPRVCLCGGPLGYKRRLCDDCTTWRPKESAA